MLTITGLTLADIFISYGWIVQSVFVKVCVGISDNIIIYELIESEHGQNLNDFFKVVRIEELVIKLKEMSNKDFLRLYKKTINLYRSRLNQQL